MSTSSASSSASPSSVVSIDESPPQPGWQLRDLERREKQVEVTKEVDDAVSLLLAIGKTHQAIKPVKAIKPKKVVLTAEQKEAKVIDFGNNRMEQHRDEAVIKSPAWGEFIPKTYLPQKVKGINGKNYPIIKSMAQAFAVAEYHNLCYFTKYWEHFEGMTPVGGITLVRGGYDLRKSSKPIAEKTSGKGKDLGGALGSWVFDFDKAEEIFILDDEDNKYKWNDHSRRLELITPFFGEAKGYYKEPPVKQVKVKFGFKKVKGEAGE